MEKSMDQELPQSEGIPVASPVLNQDQKFCMDCGKVILRRAEICPGCGCRQIHAPAPVLSSQFAAIESQLQSPLAGQMVILLVLNFLWNGLGNLAVGDKRGWSFGFINWVVFAISFFTAWIPSLLFFAYCGYAGYQFLLTKESNITPALR
jgi:hypothetical protein